MAQHLDLGLAVRRRGSRRRAGTRAVTIPGHEPWPLVERRRPADHPEQHGAEQPRAHCEVEGAPASKERIEQTLRLPAASKSAEAAAQANQTRLRQSRDRYEESLVAAQTAAAEAAAARAGLLAEAEELHIGEEVMEGM